MCIRDRNNPNIIEVRKDADETGINFGGRWHSDFSFQEIPPSLTLLNACTVPAVGGDTLYADMYSAYETLSDGMKTMLEGRRAIHSARRSYGTGGRFTANPNLTRMPVNPSPEADAEVAHPSSAPILRQAARHFMSTRSTPFGLKE